MTEATWVYAARKYLGTREVAGEQTSSTIGRWLRQLGAWWNDDETPWCGVFVGAVLRECGIEPPRSWYRARAWLGWGTAVDEPHVGCIVVFERKGGGHVGIVVGRDEFGRLLVLGGNQGDAVSVAPFSRDRVLGYRWPSEPWAALQFTRAAEAGLPLLAAAGQRTSTNEA